MNPSIFITDCEGPLTTNDNAYELASTFIPQGNHLFTILSRYDDVLAEIVKKPNYRAGNTLKFIAPFLKAYDVTNQMIQEYSSTHIRFLPGTQVMLSCAQQYLPVFIVSTSYRQYLLSLCSIIGFNPKNVYATALDLDGMSLPSDEVKQLQHLRAEITALPLITLPEDTDSFYDLPPSTRTVIQQLNRIFWLKLPQLSCGQLLRSVNPVGGVEKAYVVKAVTSQLKGHLSNVMYVGDSITDAQALQLVKANGGLSIAFNGNHYALKHANIAVLAENNFVLTLLAFLFTHFGTTRVLDFVREKRLSSLDHAESDPALLAKFKKIYSSHEPRVEELSANNLPALSRESTEYRQRVRGKAIGQLG